jgi:hypothetical protein
MKNKERSVDEIADAVAAKLQKFDDVYEGLLKPSRFGAFLNDDDHYFNYKVIREMIYDEMKKDEVK